MPNIKADKIFSAKCLNHKEIDPPKDQNKRAGRLARLGHLPDVQKVAGSNPARPTIFKWIIVSFLDCRIF